MTRTWVDWWDRNPRRRRLTLWRRLTAPQLFVGSFLFLIAVGTIGLMTLPGLYRGDRLGWLDAFFTSTSAVCVTGLIVVDTATYFTTAGQAFLLALIQLGGLGIITFTTLIAAMLGRRLSLRHEAISSGISEVAPDVDYRVLTKHVVIFTFGFELIGGVALTALWAPRLGWSAFGHGFFHAVSAFCNAGFSTFSDSLVGYQRDPGTILVVSALIVIGGIGFLTLEELLRWVRVRQAGRRVRISLQSRLVLATTALLLLGGWLAFALLEWDVTLGPLETPDKLTNALFLSVTPRTAGFNSVDYAEASDGANFLTILLMSIGGSPGSTAGGLKTTTVALLVLLAISRFRGRETTDLWGRSLPEETTERAVGLTIATFTLVTACLLVLTTAEGSGEHSAEPNSFLRYMFEAASAFNTVGLSMGVTAGLSPLSKGVLILLMFLGRVGLATAAAALILARRGADVDFRYAYEDVVVG